MVPHTTTTTKNDKIGKKKNFSGNLHWSCNSWLLLKVEFEYCLRRGCFLFMYRIKDYKFFLLLLPCWLLLLLGLLACLVGWLVERIKICVVWAMKYLPLLPSARVGQKKKKRFSVEMQRILLGFLLFRFSSVLLMDFLHSTFVRNASRRLSKVENFKGMKP